MRLKLASTLAVGFALLAVTPLPAHAQFGKFKSKLKQKVEQKVDQHTDEAAQSAVDQADNSAQCAAGTQDCSADAQAAAPAAAADASGSATAEATPVGKGAWLNFDFKPGERPLFVDDFSKDEVGDFPRRLELKEGNFEVAEWQGQRLMRGTAFGGFYIPLPEQLPERFTIEFDFSGPGGWDSGLYFGGEDDGRVTHVTLNPNSMGVDGPVRGRSETGQDLNKKLFPVRIMVDGRYVKVYAGTKRVANVPNAVMTRSNKILVKVSADDDSPVFFGNIRVMAGGKKLYDALASEGRVATQGIYFDTGSDVIQGESTPTLKEIGSMLQEHPDLKLTIEGHTDNVGGAAANQALSEKRAAAVRAYLVKNYGIDEARLSAKGYGASKPAASNDTPEGRQQNRRVELVKI